MSCIYMGSNPTPPFGDFAVYFETMVNGTTTQYMSSKLLAHTQYMSRKIQYWLIHVKEAIGKQ